MTYFADDASSSIFTSKNRTRKVVKKIPSHFELKKIFLYERDFF